MQQNFLSVSQPGKEYLLHVLTQRTSPVVMKSDEYKVKSAWLARSFFSEHLVESGGFPSRSTSITYRMSTPYTD